VLAELNRANVREVERRITAYKQEILDGAHLPVQDYRHWQWPEKGMPDADVFFNRLLLDDRRIQSIFGRQTLW
jgi:hypothetical protein